MLLVEVVVSLFRTLFFSLLAGLAQALSLASPWDGQPLWWLQLLALGVLAWQLSVPKLTLRQAFVTGWVFATAWLVGTFWWLYISLHTFGGLAAPLTVMAIVGLAGFLALYYAVICMVYRALVQSGWAWNALLFAALWVLAELARGVWFTGFPWGAVGYAHIDGPLAAYAPWVGVYGMNALAALLAMLGAQWVIQCGPQVKRSTLFRAWTGRVMPVLLIVALLGLVPWGLQTFNDNQSTLAVNHAGRLSLTLLQGNIPQDEKFQQGSGVPMALQWYSEQLKIATTSLVVAPETAIPLLPSDLPVGYLEALQQHFAATQPPQAALIGIPLGNMAEGYTNSVISLQAQPKQGAKDPGYVYSKHHLVPFGEFIPPLFRWFTAMMNIPLGDFNRGGVGQASFAWQGQRLAPNICYEDLFGEELGARFIDPTLAPTVFVNISNLGWFGDGAVMDQHVQISRLRALEFARPMVRATNTGATVVIDHRGTVTASLPRSARGVLRTEVSGRNGITPFAWWVSRMGLWPLWLLAGWVVAVAWVRKRRGGYRSAAS